jgi:hypothetical protein
MSIRRRTRWEEKAVQARKNKRERRRYAGQFPLGAPIPLIVPLKLFTLIRDPGKESNTDDLDSLKVAPDLDQALRSATEKSDVESDKGYDSLTRQ